MTPGATIAVDRGSLTRLLARARDVGTATIAAQDAVWALTDTDVPQSVRAALEALTEQVQRLDEAALAVDLQLPEAL